MLIKKDFARSATGCLGVNAAFLREIKDDNLFLDELLLATRDAFAEIEPNRLNVGASVELVRRLRDRLAMHFSLEEELGYIPGAIAFPAELSDLAETCREQHRSLYTEVCEVVEAAERLWYEDAPPIHDRLTRNLSTTFRRFYRHMRQHDICEDDLIRFTAEKQNNRRSRPLPPAIVSSIVRQK